MNSRARIGEYDRGARSISAEFSRTDGEDWLIRDYSGGHMKLFWSMVGWSSVAIGVLCLTLLGHTVQAEVYVAGQAFGVGDPECDRRIPHC